MPRAKKIKLYSEEQMNLAIKEVQNNKVGVSRAAHTFGVPQTTLSDRINGKEFLFILV